MATVQGQYGASNDTICSCELVYAGGMGSTTIGPETAERCGQLYELGGSVQGSSEIPKLTVCESHILERRTHSIQESRNEIFCWNPVLFWMGRSGSHINKRISSVSWRIIGTNQVVHPMIFRACTRTHLHSINAIRSNQADI
jgi:hypothetical protein